MQRHPWRQTLTPPWSDTPETSIVLLGASSRNDPYGPWPVQTVGARWHAAAMTRSAAKDPGIIRAQLDGHARWLIRNGVERDQCITEIHEITRDPVLLGQASGTALGAWQHNPVSGHDGDKVSRMLDAAGADPVYRDRAAAETLERLRRDQGRPGIGMPS